MSNVQYKTTAFPSTEDTKKKFIEQKIENKMN